MRPILPLLAGLLTACATPPPPSEVAAVAIAASAAPAPPKVHVSAPQGGTVTITGDAGAIDNPKAERLLIGIVHDLLGTYVLLHAGSTVVVGGAKVPLLAGGFDPVRIGDAGGPAQTGDRVILVPKDAADAACGETTYMVVP